MSFKHLQDSYSNSLLKKGSKVYSQNDEDGITFEILRRLGKLSGGTFIEFGVSQGQECNTLSLMALGWSGAWIGGEDLIVNVNPHNSADINFTYTKAWVTKHNIVDLYNHSLRCIKQPTANVVSLDLDGNDYHFVQELLGNVTHPDLFIVEYNAKFIPPIKWTMEYNDSHQWDGSDYQGASLALFQELFESHGYLLVCCNITSSNAFFVKSEYARLFDDIPSDIRELYMPPNYSVHVPSGHLPAIQTIQSLINRLNTV